MHTTRLRPLTPAQQAEVFAEWNDLPHARITSHHDAAHIFTASLTELEAWYLAAGGTITHQPAGDGVTKWTLTTTVNHGTGTPLYVHALALDTDLIDDYCRPAITHPTA
ncbi:hypothetical protein D0Z67_29405 (plasmid) [Streptomyces seoulensis]|uniref:Uncharacterized protein n=1 Tax=Streptomyces seoulensis TaxID=73044 RepID=A0A4P6U564_STRSO|nr:hypothetical protein [Streptomyces seoulensis]QBJ94487.1 hypothetical protein D0Z67_29405 [Streptomyces seoulensis]